MSQKTSGNTQLRNAFKQQSHAEVGFMPDMDRLRSARERVFKTLDMANCLGGAIYFADPRHEGEIGVLDQVSINSSPDHKMFVASVLQRRRLVAAHTSVGETLDAKKTGIQASKMAAHDCLNIYSGSACLPVVFQFVFQQGTKIDQDKIEEALNRGTRRLPSLKDQTHQIIDQYNGRLGILLGLNPPQGKINGIVVATDITNSSGILSECGETVWDDFLNRWNKILDRFISDYGGVLISEAGDGVKIGFTSDNKIALMAADKIRDEFKAFKTEFFHTPDDNMGLFLRTAISSGYFTGEVWGQVFLQKPKIRYNGLGLAVAEMMLDSAERYSDVTMITPETAVHLDVRGTRYPVPSTLMPYVLKL